MSSRQSPRPASKKLELHGSTFVEGWPVDDPTSKTKLDERKAVAINRSILNDAGRWPPEDRNRNAPAKTEVERRQEPRLVAMREGRRPVPASKQPLANSSPTNAMTKSSAAHGTAVTAADGALCSNSGCAYLCTGLAPSHCCKLCSRTPGSHGPNCEKKTIACSSEGCPFVCTGLSPTHCCHSCASGKGHGPHCWEMMAEEAAPEAGSAAGGGAAAADESKADTEGDEETRRSELAAAAKGHQGTIASNEAKIKELRQALG